MTGREVIEWILDHDALKEELYVENGGSPAPGEFDFEIVDVGDKVKEVVIMVR